LLLAMVLDRRERELGEHDAGLSAALRFGARCGSLDDAWSGGEASLLANLAPLDAGRGAGDDEAPVLPTPV
jgi:hypothetical protein